MADIIEKSDWNTMKSWVQSIYAKTKGTTPSISDPAQGGVVLASQAKELQNLLNTAYSSYKPVGCSAHYSTNLSTNNGSQKTSNTTIRNSSDLNVVNSSYQIGYGCSSQYTTDKNHNTDKASDYVDDSDK